MAKILLVEDNELSRDMFSRRLARRGYEVICAVNGKEALAMARDRHPDLILMDLHLPDMDGREAAGTLKGEQGTAGIPIIALSAYSTQDHRDRAAAAGCDDYQTKPVEIEQLVKKIQKLVRIASIRAGTFKAVG